MKTYRISGLCRHYRCTDARSFYKKFSHPGEYFRLADIMTTAALLHREPYEVFALMLDVNTVAMSKAMVTGWNRTRSLVYVLTDDEKEQILSIDNRVGFRPDDVVRVPVCDPTKRKKRIR
jgi:hypothetical protein